MRISFTADAHIFMTTWGHAYRSQTPRNTDIFKHTPKDSQMNSLISEIHCRLSRDTITIELRKIYIKILYIPLDKPHPQSYDMYKIYIYKYFTYISGGDSMYFPVSALLIEYMILSVVESRDSYGYEISQTVKKAPDNKQTTHNPKMKKKQTTKKQTKKTQNKQQKTNQARTRP